MISLANVRPEPLPDMSVCEHCGGGSEREAQPLHVLGQTVIMSAKRNLVMPSFAETFGEPVYMSDGSYAISGNYTREEAAQILSDELGEEIKPEALESDRVRFGFPPDYVEEASELGACWYTGAGSGRGTKPVWVL